MGPIRTALDDPSENVRVAAARALCRMARPKEALPVLVRVLYYLDELRLRDQLSSEGNANALDTAMNRIYGESNEQSLTGLPLRNRGRKTSRTPNPR